VVALLYLAATWAAVAADIVQTARFGAGPTNTIRILSQFKDLNVFEGESVAFTVMPQGEAPFAYDWYYNGELIHYGIGSTLELPPVEGADAGTYQVIIRREWEETPLAPFNLIVRPRIDDQIALEGERVVLRLQKNRLKPGKHQWLHNWHPLDSPRARGTNRSTLLIRNSKPEDAGEYRHRIEHTDGTETYFPGYLSILPRRGCVVSDNTFTRIEDIPFGLSDVIAVESSGRHCIALKANGTVVTWGDNSSGECDIPGGLTNVIAIAAGYGFGGYSMALRADGTVIGWGRYEPAPEGLTNVVAISAVGGSLALRSDGTVVSWNGLYEPDISGSLTNVVAISAGGGHALALLGDGTVVAWGNNEYGETDVPSGLKDVISISAATIYSLALRRDGTVVAWGGEKRPYAEAGGFPAVVPKGLRDVVAIAAGEGASAALTRNGQVVWWRWGFGNHLTVLRPAGLKGVAAIRLRGITLTALFTRPLFVSQPESLVATNGAAATLSALAVGREPISYQWLYNGRPILGATNSTYVIASVESTDGGRYGVRARNEFGVETSSTARLTTVDAGGHELE